MVRNDALIVNIFAISEKYDVWLRRRTITPSDSILLQAKFSDCNDVFMRHTSTIEIVPSFLKGPVTSISSSSFFLTSFKRLYSSVS